MKTVFILQHLHIMPNGEEEIKLIGVFDKIQEVEIAILQLQVQPGFSDFPNLIEPLLDDKQSGFYIDKYVINNVHWKEGFVTK
jgi:hypothetical protein